MAWEPSHQWGGIDGNWSTFSLSIGTPPQQFQALISTNSTSLCVPFASTPNYPNSTYYPELSNSWKPNGGASHEGSDVMTVGPTGEFPWQVPIEECSFDSGSLAFAGVKPLSTYRWSKPSPWFDASPQSFPQWPWTKPVFTLLQSNPNAELKRDTFDYEATGMLYAYTAGAWYRQYPGAFSIGYYDEARGPGDDEEGKSIISMLDDDENHLMEIDITFIKSNQTLSSTKPRQFLSDKITALIDSTKPFLELPEETCQKLSQAYDLDYDPLLNLFFVNKITRDNLLRLDPKISFVLKRSKPIYNNPDAPDRNNQTIEIILPFGAFDHQIHLTPNSEPRHYFPITVAHDGLYVLGRVFLQETYLIVNHGWSNHTPPFFIISPAVFPQPWSNPSTNLTAMSGFDGMLRVIYVGWFAFFGMGLLFWLFVFGVLVLSLDFVTAYMLGISRSRHLRDRDRKLEELWMKIHSADE